MEYEKEYCAACAHHGTDRHDDNCPAFLTWWVQLGIEHGYINKNDDTLNGIHVIELDLDD